MTYAITYRKNNEVHAIEWIAPRRWSVAAVSRCFAHQFPGAELLSLEPRQ